MESGAAFIKETSASYGTQTRISVNSSVKYDLVGKLVEETKLTRKDIIAILRGIQKPVFEQFKDNPEEFIIKAAALINDEKATAIIQHITYDVLDERYGTEVFTDPTIRGKLGVNAMKAKKSFLFVRSQSGPSEVESGNRYGRKYDTIPACHADGYFS